MDQAMWLTGVLPQNLITAPLGHQVSLLCNHIRYNCASCVARWAHRNPVWLVLFWQGSSMAQRTHSRLASTFPYKPGYQEIEMKLPVYKIHCTPNITQIHTTSPFPQFTPVSIQVFWLLHLSPGHYHPTALNTVIRLLGKFYCEFFCVFFPNFYNGSNSDLFKHGRGPGLLMNVNVV